MSHTIRVAGLFRRFLQAVLAICSVCGILRAEETARPGFTKRVTKSPVDIRFAYYPYSNRMRLLADVTGLPEDAKLERLEITIREKGGKDIRKLSLNSFNNGQRETELSMPELEGEYEIAAVAIGQGIPRDKMVKPFVRTRYEWEHGNLGKSMNVYAPFTPLRLTDNTLSCVMRDHTLNALGLWDQVNVQAQNTGIRQDLLAASIGYAVTVDGAPETVVPEPMEIIEAGEARVVTRSAFRAGPLTARSESTWDVDGMMLVHLSLDSSEEHPVTAFTLEIPILASQAPMIHTMGDGSCSTICEKLPPGNGPVWDAAKVTDPERSGRFCPYIFLGSAVRGLCWFAENDAGWSRDRQAPNLSIVRANGCLTLNVHLINSPVVISKPREIVFGLQAAPLKPRLAPWRYRWYRDGYTLPGTDNINGVTPGHALDLYPPGKDLWFWEQFRKGNETNVSGELVAEVIARGLPYSEPYGEDEAARWIRYVEYSMRGRQNRKTVFCYNRASCQAADEFQTFQDEWALTDYRMMPSGNNLDEIKVVPSESFIDFNLYWYLKSFEVAGNLGVCWDNWYLQPSFNTAQTAAYRRPDGTVTPAGGLLGLRELSRRTFQMMNERGMLPVTMPHMASAGILPMCGFATVQCDWERKDSCGDAQDRFPRECLLLAGNGELAGTWPVLLADYGEPARDPWIRRTLAAVSILHELDLPANTPETLPTLIDPIIRLLDTPGLQVYRYWDERLQPVTAEQPGIFTIVYSIPGKEAIVAVTSYAETDVPVSLDIDLNALGLRGDCRAVDVENSQTLPIRNTKAAFLLKKHDIRELRILPE